MAKPGSCWAGSLDIGFNSLPAAREGGAEDAEGAGPGRSGKLKENGKVGRKEEAAQQQTPGEITSSPHRFVIVS